MASPTRAEEQRQLLSTILRTIRTERHMTAAAVAEKMAMPVRTYQGFEAGQGPLEIERLRLFAEATDSDAVAILAALVFGAPDFALRAMNNKFGSIVWAVLKTFNDEVGEKLNLIEPAAVLEASRRMFDALGDHLDRRDTSTERWMQEHVGRLFEANEPPHLKKAP